MHLPVWTLTQLTIWRIDEVASECHTKGDVWSFTINNPNLVNYWKFDEKTGTIAHDSAGSCNGTIYGRNVDNRTY